MTISEVLNRQVGARGECDAVVDPGRGLLTYRDLARHGDELAGRLRSLGVGRGDRVAVMLPNCAEYCVAYVALMRLGAVLVAVNNRYRPDELRYAIEHSQAWVVIFDNSIEAENRKLLGELAGGLADGDLPGVRLIEVDCSAGYLSPREWRGDGERRAVSSEGIEALPQLGEISDDEPAVVIFTSGTTGRPKGAVLTQGNVLASARGYGDRMGVGKDDRVSIFTPMFHAGGLVNGATMALLYGAAAVLLPRFEVGAARRVLAEHEVSVYLAVPTMLVAHCEAADVSAELPALRVIVTGGSSVYPRLIRQTRAHFGDAVNIHVVYGLSEANMATVTEPLAVSELGDTVPVGRATSEFEVDVEADAGEVGEVLIRGNGVFSGYWNDGEATAAALGADGWFRTGDLGQLDESGSLTIVGRKKDMYIRGGANVYPAEVERVLETHPDVLHAAVIGVPDDRLGEVGKAILTAAPGTEIVTDDILAFAAEQLASYKLPSSIEVRDSLPLTPFGKIWKSKLREELA